MNNNSRFGWPKTVADLEGAEPAPPPPLLGDGLTQSLTVLMICDNGTVLWRHHRQCISSNAENMVLRICKMIATSGFLAALECTKFAPSPRWGSLQRSPRPSATLSRN